ncbi:MAG: hypothetical protein JOZ03_13970 [Gammaproteobacteria bacterium]|nr:hypothetical protein [Gammaproteobacteria bacterium]
MTSSPLAEWENFYVIVGSAAGGLTGLTFVVISLTSEAHRALAAGVRSFVTPTIVHFSAVLALAAFLSVPHQTPRTVAGGLAAGGVCGLLYVGLVAYGIHRVRPHYVAVAEDWLWNVIVPALAYACLALMGYVAWADLATGLYGAALAALALLFAGIHNAWDVAVWNSIRRNNRAPRDS